MFEERKGGLRLAESDSAVHFEKHYADLGTISIDRSEGCAIPTGFPGIMKPARNGDRTLSDSMMFVVARIMHVGIYRRLSDIVQNICMRSTCHLR